MSDPKIEGPEEPKDGDGQQNGETQNDNSQNANEPIPQFDPRCVYPANLQDKDLEQDLWERMKRHPVRNPALYQKNLDDDPFARELVRQVMSAARAREMEIVLHHQARLFSVVLAHVLQGVSRFMSEPVTSHFRTVEAKRTPAAGIAGPTLVRKPKAKESKSFIYNFITFWLTPKYIAVAVIAFLGLATGWSQLELHHLRQATQSFKDSVALNAELQNKMEATIASSKETMADLQKKLDSTGRELADRESKVTEIEGELRDAKSTIELNKGQIERLTQQVADMKELKQLKDSDKDTQIAAITKDKEDLTKKLTDSIAELKSTQAINTRLLSIEKEYNDSVKKHADEKLKNDRDNAELQKQIIELVRYKALLRDALHCIDKVNQTINKWRYDHDEVKKTLEIFSTQKTTRLEGLTSPP